MYVKETSGYLSSYWCACPFLWTRGLIDLNGVTEFRFAATLPDRDTKAGRQSSYPTHLYGTLHDLTFVALVPLEYLQVERGDSFDQICTTSNSKRSATRSNDVSPCAVRAWKILPSLAYAVLHQ